MSTSNTTTTATSARSSAATSSKVRTFVITFAVVGVLLYCVCLFLNLPTFTYHPAVNRIEWGWGPARSGEGPAMYWYGWLATSGLGALAAAAIANWVPAKLWSGLAWAVPVAEQEETPPAVKPTLLGICSGCGKKLRGGPELLGKMVKCPQCGQGVRLPRE